MIRRKKAPELIFVVLIFVTAVPGAGSIRAHLTYINHTPRVNHTPSDPPAFVHRDRGAPPLADVFIAMEKFSIESCVRGYHIYSDIWEASVGEQLPCEREAGKRAMSPVNRR